MQIVVTALASAFAVVVSLAIWCLIGVLPTWLLWNWLMPSIFHVREITFWETFGLLMLAGFLFKSSGGSSSKS